MTRARTLMLLEKAPNICMLVGILLCTEINKIMHLKTKNN